jgi:hypothetical protein
MRYQYAVNSKFGRVVDYVVMTYSYYYLDICLEKMKLQNLQLGDPVRQPRYEPGTS